jgi:hypothetical protein
MPGPVLHVGAGISCPHAAPASVVPGSPRVLINGSPVATMANTYPVAGCPFQIPIGTGTKPQPCIKLQWVVPAVRVQVMGAPVVLATSSGFGTSAEGMPQGPSVVAAVQPRVVAT